MPGELYHSPHPWGRTGVGGGRWEVSGRTHLAQQCMGSAVLTVILAAGQGFLGSHSDVSDTQGHLGTRQTTLQVSPHAPATPGEV